MSAQKTGKPKVSFYQDDEDTDRVRGAILHTMIPEGPRNLSQFIHQAVMEKVERLEAKYNDGQPFPPCVLASCPKAARWMRGNNAAMSLRGA